jgi:hypothetical protein
MINIDYLPTAPEIFMIAKKYPAFTASRPNFTRKILEKKTATAPK